MVGALSALTAVVTLWFAVFQDTTPFVIVPLFVAAGAGALVYKRWVALTVVLLMALLPLSLWIVRVLTMPDMKRPITSAPRFYPVVVVGRTDRGILEPQVIYLFELPQIKKKYPSWSFLVPKNEIERMQKQVASVQSGKTISGEELWFPSFKVKTNGDGTQEFEVSGALDDDATNTSWYHAEEQNITAQYLESYGRQDVPAESCGAGALMMVFWFVSCVVVIPHVAKRNRRASTTG